MVRRVGERIHSDPHALLCLYFLEGGAGIFFDHTAQGGWSIPDLCRQFMKRSGVVMLCQVPALRSQSTERYAQQQ